MIFPTAAYFHKTARKTFTDKSTILRQRNRTPVVGLNIRLDAVKFELLKGAFQDQQQSLTHQPFSSVR